MLVAYKSLDFGSFFTVLLHRLRIEASHTETTDSFCAAGNRMYRNEIARSILELSSGKILRPVSVTLIAGCFL